MLALKDHQLVADAGADTILRVQGGHTSLWTVLTAGDTSRVNPVPTSLARGPKGNIYVGTLYSLAPHKARLLRYSPNGHLQHTWWGFTSITGVAVGHHGSVYVSQLFAGCPQNSQTCIPGKVTRIARDGSRHSMRVPVPRRTRGAQRAPVRRAHGALHRRRERSGSRTPAVRCGVSAEPHERSLSRVLTAQPRKAPAPRRNPGAGAFTPLPRSDTYFTRSDTYFTPPTLISRIRHLLTPDPTPAPSFASRSAGRGVCGGCYVCGDEHPPQITAHRGRGPTRLMPQRQTARIGLAPEKCLPPVVRAVRVTLAWPQRMPVAAGEKK